MTHKSVSEKNIDEMTLEELKQRIPFKELSKLEEKANEEWEKATLSNNDVFINFCNNKEMCGALIHVLLKNFNIKLNNPKFVYEKTSNKFFNSKEVKFDFYIEDDYIIIDMEMQVILRLLPPKRVRSYQAVIDVEQLKKSKHYDSLKDTYIIIICLEDPFGYDLPAYRIKKTPVSLDLDEFEEDEFNLDEYIDESFDKNLFDNIEEFNKEKLEEFLNNQKKKYKKKEFEEYIDGANIIYFNASAFHKVKNKELR